MKKEYEEVCYELLRPEQVKAIREKCPIVYIPAGSLEWHGVQNPLGTDGLKAHAICCEAAIRHGGIVLPAFYLGILGDREGWGPAGWKGFTVTSGTVELMWANMFRLALGLIADGWKTLVGVTGHDIEPQRDAIHNAIQQAAKGSPAKGFAITEGENWEGGEAMRFSMDHAGAWETSVMMAVHPGRVDLESLRTQMGDRAGLDKLEMKEAEGIGGFNPLKHASAELGDQIIRFCADRIGRRAVEVLEGKILPLDKADKRFMDNPGPR
ncbi:MAG: creatininase family protein [Planctomycetes bacterium]|nr:creatininase family protein [Planctomycetota bacterium]